MKVWNAFARSRRVRIIYFALAGALLLASIVGLGVSGRAPAEEGRLNYEHRGQFNYIVYLKPSILYGDVVLTEEEAQEQVPMVFFRDIIRDVRLSFRYNFSSNQPLTSVTNKVKVSLIAEDPGVWQKEMTELEKIHTGTEFAVSFPLILNRLESIFNDIQEDIGVSASKRQVIIRAVVQTTAKTALGTTIKDEFSYELTALLTTKRLELKGALDGSEQGYVEGVRYEGKGRFDYEISLKPNRLYGTTVLKSEAPVVTQPPSFPQTLGPGLVYFPKIIGNIQASFSYWLVCDSPLRDQLENVRVTATVENPGQWSKTLVVVPETSKTGDFTISFPIDIEYFTMVIDAIGKETGVRGTSYNVVLKAEVQTFASTEFGAVIAETYTQTLSGKLESNTLTFDKELSSSKSGSVSAPTPEPSQTGSSRAPWVVVLVIALLALAYFGWCQTQLRAGRVSAGEAEAARAKKKYRQIMVDVAELPEVKSTETVIPLNSLDDLVRIADDLVKPVLHQAREAEHAYCVIDSGVRYLYIIKT